MGKHLAHGHKFHDHDSNPHPMTEPQDLQIDTLNMVVPASLLLKVALSSTPCKASNMHYTSIIVFIFFKIFIRKGIWQPQLRLDLSAAGVWVLSRGSKSNGDTGSLLPGTFRLCLKRRLGLTFTARERASA